MTGQPSVSPSPAVMSDQGTEKHWESSANAIYLQDFGPLPPTALAGLWAQPARVSLVLAAASGTPTPSLAPGPCLPRCRHKRDPPHLPPS